MRHLEKHFENKVKRFLKDKNCWFIKYWGGASFTKAGIPDLLVCCNGYFLGVELKDKNGKPSELQLYNLRKINENGGIGLLLYPNYFEEFKRLIEYLINFKNFEAHELATKINERSG